jgi:hypothetical protein
MFDERMAKSGLHAPLTGANVWQSRKSDKMDRAHGSPGKTVPRKGSERDIKTIGSFLGKMQLAQERQL